MVSFKLLDRFLLAICFVSVMVWLFNQYRMAVVTPEHQRLVAIYGEMDIGDGTEFVIISIPTESPYTFAWRCHVPPNKNFNVRSGFGKNGTRDGTNFSPILEDVAIEYRQSVHFDLQANQIKTTEFGYGRSTVRAFGNAQWVEFLKEHWNKLDIDVLAADQNAVRLVEDKSTKLLSVRIPESLRPQLENMIGKEKAEEFFENPFFQTSFNFPKKTAISKAKPGVAK